MKLLTFSTLCLVLGSAVQGATGSAPITELSLEQLINIEVTSVGKKEGVLLRAPAAVAVLTSEDIRRMGATSIPEALRAVPGMHVARINANRWAVSARGLNDEYSNKLLVLIDGRSVYSPVFGGVHWNVQDVVLEDLDRIEIIRGPGGTLWGANAVNGVINIMTRSARETQGTMVSVLGGTEDQPSVTARYGGTISSNVFFRVYGKYFRRDGFEDGQGNNMSDHWDIGRGGARIDWEPSERNTFTLSGDYLAGTYGEQVGKIALTPVPDFRNMGVDAGTHAGNIVGRWTSRFSEDSELKVQVYYDGYKREHPFGGGVLVAAPNEFDPDQNQIREWRDTWDLDLQHRFRVLSRNEIVWGVEYRHTEDRIDAVNASQTWFKARARDNLFSAFVQNEFAIIEDKLSLTVGSKFEHNDYTGFEFQPSGRLAWTPTEHQTLWASVGRAVRTPTRLERDARIDIAATPVPGPALISNFGNPNAGSETMLAYEIGYRIEPAHNVSFDVAAFYNTYELLANLPTDVMFELDPFPHSVQRYESLNDFSGHTCGVEVMAQWQVTNPWRLTAGYTLWKGSFPGNDYRERTSPEQQFNVRSSLSLGRNWEFNAAVYYVDRVEALTQGTLGAMKFDPVVRLDLGLNWRATENLEFSVWGQNLLDNGHPEFSGYKSSRVAEIPRTFYGKVTLRF